ncbi:hypothetical protein QJS04_geneDACA020829 [Acorus gramineus]|uniref:Uncharacterized protein n=1 Tax=Acorus gramineus TaxID=55184 RepID=A0AAV9BQ63_ACOGR|nr:hypothetical protein QJS04_geneDACA020829 [Acorus gramineus]
MFQSLLFPVASQVSWTEAILLSTVQKRLGKHRQNGDSPHHLSIQNRMLALFPSFQQNSASNSPARPSHPLHMNDIVEMVLGNTDVVVPPPYLSCITLPQSEDSSEHHFHNHLARSASFIERKSRMHSPPFSLG